MWRLRETSPDGAVQLSEVANGGLTASKQQRFSLATILLLVFLVPALLFGVGLDVPVGGGPNLVCHVAVIVYAAWRLSQLVGLGEPRWFATIFWAFVYVWMGLAATAQWIAGRDSFGRSISQSADLGAVLAILVGLVAWDLAYRFRVRDRSTEALVRNRRIVTPQTVLAFAWLSLVLSLPALLYQGGLDLYLGTRRDFTLARQAAGIGTEAGQLAQGGLLTAAVQIPPAVAVLGYFLAIRHYRQLRRDPLWWLLGIFILGMNILVNNPMGNSRFWFGTVLLGLLFTLPVFNRPAGYRAAVISLLVGLTLIFPYSDYFRSEGWEVDRQGVAEFMVRKLDYDAYSQVSPAMRRAEEVGVENGHQAISALGFAIPRSFWPGKAEPTGAVLARFNGFEFENLSAPLWAEGLVDWGWAGLVGYLGAAGLLSRIADRRYLDAIISGLPLRAVILYPPLAVYTLILLRGSLLGTIASGAALAAALLSIGLVRRRGRVEDATEAPSLRLR